MFFNMRDPILHRTNDPTKIRASWHIAVVVANLIFLGWLIAAMVGYNVYISAGLAIGLIVGLYVVYIIVGCCCSDIKPFIENMKKFDQYQETYDGMVRGKGFFRFWI
jgi:hypothetical protein